ncbi:MAG: ABC transporter permease subunit [Planctomycetes bacterium]|nr:ABC transporter permease subunit [Planctomycetota bacterium]
MYAGALVARELAAAGRARRALSLRLAVALAASVALFLTWPRVGDAAMTGREVFATLVRLVFLMAYLVAPLVAADAVARERSQGTLGLLLLTDLGAVEVVLAKFAARAAEALVLVLTAAPVACAVCVLGGVGPRDVLAVGMAVLAGVVLALGAGVLGGVLARGTAAAALVAYGLLAALRVLVRALDLPVHRLDPYDAVNYLLAPRDYQVLPRPEAAWVGPVAVAGLGLACLVASAALLRRVAARDAVGRARTARGAARPLARVALVAGLALVAMAWGAPRLAADRGAQAALMSALALLSTAAVVVRGAGRVVEDRRSGTMALVALSLMPARDLVWREVRQTVLDTWPLAALCAVHVLALASAGHLDPGLAVAQSLAVVLGLGLYPLLGVCVGLRAEGAANAMVWALVTVVLEGILCLPVAPVGYSTFLIPLEVASRMVATAGWTWVACLPLLGLPTLAQVLLLRLVWGGSDRHLGRRA